MRDFRELKVWNVSHELCLLVYGITKQFPNDERYGVISQIRRASASVPTNIAESCGRDSNKEFVRFLRISARSISEVECLLILSKDLNYTTEEQKKELVNLVVSVRKMLFNLVKAIL